MNMKKKKPLMFFIIAVQLICILLYFQVRAEMNKDAHSLHEEATDEISNYNNQINEIFP